MPKPIELKNIDFKPTIFNQIEAEITKRKSSESSEEVIALHVGDTWFDLPEEMSEPLNEEPFNNRMSRYGNTQGDLSLRELLAHKTANTNQLPVSSPSEIQVTFGATGALFLALHKLLEPGDDLLVLSPQWTIFKVVASTARVHMIEVPFFDRLSQNPDADILKWIEPYVTDKTRGIYYNNPNNPSGVLMAKSHLEAIARFAKDRDLWVLSDEAYEDFVWTGQPYVSIGSLPGMFERTISVFSFSKSYAAAGLRLGYIAAPNGAIATLNPGHVGVGYEPNRPSQVAGIRALKRHDQIIKRIQHSYLENRKAAMDNLDLPYLNPQGSFYLFVDLRESWLGLDDNAKLKKMMDAGVVVSPGKPFGSAYDGWVRFCYTAEPAEKIAEAARRMNRLI